MQDGSGSISRQELAAVLKGLNPTDARDMRELRGWEEFVEWVFAAMKVDSSVGSEYHLDRVTKEQETKMIEEIFTHFDLDEDPACLGQMWMDGTQQKEETFVWMANLVELYTNKSYQMNISKDA
eukprot:g18561.t1